MSEMFLTKAELAEILKVSTSSIDNYLKEGMPAAINYPPRFVLDEVLAWIKTRERANAKKDEPKEG